MPIPPQSYCGKHSAHERAITMHDKRLDSHSESIKSINECLIKLTTLLEHSLTHQEQVNDRLTALESIPSKHWNAVVTTAITALVTGLVGAALAVILVH